MKLVEISRYRSGRGVLQFENGERIEVPLQVLQRVEIETGRTYQPDVLRNDLRRKSRDVLARVARRYLSQYQKSREEFFEHFHRKGYTEDILRNIMESLRREGYLDDERVAREHVKRRLQNKKIGRRKLLSELQSKGLDNDLAQSIVNEKLDRERERKMAAQFAENHSELSERQLVSRLKTRGFPVFVIREVVSAVRE